MGRSASEMNSSAENAKGATGYEGIIKPSAGDVYETGAKKSKVRSKEEIISSMLTTAEGAAKAKKAPRVIDTRKSTTPTQRPGTVAEGQRRAKTNEVKQPFLDMHRQISTVINTARNLRGALSPDHHDAMDSAVNHLQNSIHSYHRAVAEGGLGSNNMNNDVAHGHLQDAVKHLTYAHETLVASGVHEALQSKNLTSPLPSDDAVSDLAAKSTTLERKGVGGVAGQLKPYKEGVLGRNARLTKTPKGYVISRPSADGGTETAEFGHRDLHAMSRVFGREHPAIQKMYSMMGTERGKEYRVSGGQRQEGVVRATGAGVASGAPAGVNPKKRGSGRRIDTRFSTQANPSRNTPTFEG